MNRENHSWKNEVSLASKHFIAYDEREVFLGESRNVGHEEGLILEKSEFYIFF